MTSPVRPLTDEEWNSLQAILPLPDVARHELNKAINTYRRSIIADGERLRPEHIKDQPRKVAKSAETLIGEISNLPRDAMFELIRSAETKFDPPGSTQVDFEIPSVPEMIDPETVFVRPPSVVTSPRMKPISDIQDLLRGLSEFSQWAETTAHYVDRKPTRDRTELDELIRCIDEILILLKGNDYKIVRGEGNRKSQAISDLVHKICEITSPNITRGSVVNAIKRCVQIRRRRKA